MIMKSSTTTKLMQVLQRKNIHRRQVVCKDFSYFANSFNHVLVSLRVSAYFVDCQMTYRGPFVEQFRLVLLIFLLTVVLCGPLQTSR